MRRFSGVIVLTAIAVVGWQIGGILSHDALSLMLGVIFGIMAGIPAALVALSGNRTVRHEHTHHLVRDEAPKPVPMALPARARLTVVRQDAARLPMRKEIEVKR